jgi:hypothetical protein
MKIYICKYVIRTNVNIIKAEKTDPMTTLKEKQLIIIEIGKQKKRENAV